MVVDYVSAYKAVEIVLKNHEGSNTVISSFKCGAVSGISVLGASILFGPLGVLAGAAVGATIAYTTHKNKFKSIFEVVRDDMSEEEREKLIEHVRIFIRKFGVSDAVVLIKLAQGDINFQMELFAILKTLIANWQQNSQNL